MSLLLNRCKAAEGRKCKDTTPPNQNLLHCSLPLSRCLFKSPPSPPCENIFLYTSWNSFGPRARRGDPTLAGPPLLPAILPDFLLEAERRIAVLSVREKVSQSVQFSSWSFFNPSLVPSVPHLVSLFFFPWCSPPPSVIGSPCEWVSLSWSVLHLALFHLRRSSFSFFFLDFGILIRIGKDTIRNRIELSVYHLEELVWCLCSATGAKATIFSPAKKKEWGKEILGSKIFLPESSSSPCLLFLVVWFLPACSYCSGDGTASPDSCVEQEYLLRHRLMRAGKVPTTHQ